MQHYLIKFVIDMRQVGGFLRVLRFPPPIKLTTTITEILLKVALITINQTNPNFNKYISVENCGVRLFMFCIYQLSTENRFILQKKTIPHKH